MLQCAYLLHLSFSLGGFGRLHLSISSFSLTSALASRGQSCSRQGFQAAMISPVFFTCDYGPWLGTQAQYKRWMRIAGLYDPTIAPQNSVVWHLEQKQDFDVLRRVLSLSRLVFRQHQCLLTAQGMLLTLRHLEHALIKFLQLAISHILRCDGNPTVEIFLSTHERENSRCYPNLGINICLNQFTQNTFAFKSSCVHTLNLPILSLTCVFSKSCPRTISSFL